MPGAPAARTAPAVARRSPRPPTGGWATRFGDEACASPGVHAKNCPVSASAIFWEADVAGVCGGTTGVAFCAGARGDCLLQKPSGGAVALRNFVYPAGNFHSPDASQCVELMVSQSNTAASAPRHASPNLGIVAIVYVALKVASVFPEAVTVEAR